MLRLIIIFWPSFMTAIVGEVVFFAFINPQELYLNGQPVYWGPMAVYFTGFLMFWSLTALTTALSLLLEKPVSDINDRLRPSAAPNLR